MLQPHLRPLIAKSRAARRPVAVVVVPFLVVLVVLVALVVRGALVPLPKRLVDRHLREVSPVAGKQGAFGHLKRVSYSPLSDYC